MGNNTASNRKIKIYDDIADAIILSEENLEKHESLYAKDNNNLFDNQLNKTNELKIRNCPFVNNES